MDHSGTMIQVRCHGFFNENLLASAKSCKHRLQVEFFGRNHIHRIDDIQLAKVSEHGTNMGNVEGFGYRFSPLRHRIINGGYLNSGNGLIRPQMAFTEKPTTDHPDPNRFHEYDSLIWES